MERLVRIRPGEIDLPEGGNLVKGEAYADLLEARALFADIAKEREKVREEAEEIFEDASRRGYEDGQEKAKLEMSMQMIEVVSGTVDYLSKVETDIIEVVSLALERILGELDQDDLNVRVIRNALSKVRNQRQLTLRVAPGQLANVQGRVTEILADYPAIVELDVEADARLSETGCILESEIGIIDASLEGQLRTLRKAFEKVLGDRAG